MDNINHLRKCLRMAVLMSGCIFSKFRLLNCSLHTISVNLAYKIKHFIFLDYINYLTMIAIMVFTLSSSPALIFAFNSSIHFSIASSKPARTFNVTSSVSVGRTYNEFSKKSNRLLRRKPD